MSDEENSREELLEEKEELGERVSDVVFGQVIKECGAVLLQKGQTPALKCKKKAALEEVRSSLLINKGVNLSDQQIAKKLNNLKTRVKQKTDLKKTGNKRVRLNEGEETIYNLLGAEENPSINRVEYGVTIGTDLTKSETSNDAEVTARVLPTWKKKEKENPIAELQRVVLQKQLEVFELQKDVLMKTSNVLDKIDKAVDKFNSSV